MKVFVIGLLALAVGGTLFAAAYVVITRGEETDRKAATAKREVVKAKVKADKSQREVREIRTVLIRKEIARPGPNGLQGVRGPFGLRGPRGFQGPPGRTGTPGKPGATIAEVANALLQACAARECGVRGPAGPQGEPGGDGDAGPQGADGTPGTPGEPGPPGADGAVGPAGPQGVPGPTGPAGPAGPAGPPGQAPPPVPVVCDESLGYVCKGGG